MHDGFQASSAGVDRGGTADASGRVRFRAGGDREEGFDWVRVHLPARRIATLRLGRSRARA